MPFARYKDPSTGHEMSLSTTVEPGFPDLIRLDKAATDSMGRPLPAKHFRPLRELTTNTEKKES